MMWCQKNMPFLKDLDYMNCTIIKKCLRKFRTKGVRMNKCFTTTLGLRGLNRVTGHVKQALSQFNMDMKEINYPQGLRFIKYDSSELGFQNWHTDKSKDTRILSCVIQLSDPLSYTGANLEFESRRLSNEVSREQGSINIFPSGQIHRVTECTSGIRYSLVIWAEETNDELPEGFVNGQ